MQIADSSAFVPGTSSVASGFDTTAQTLTSLAMEETSNVIYTGSTIIVMSIDDQNATGAAADDSGAVLAGKATFEVPFFVALLICGGLGNLLVIAVYSQKKFRNSNAAMHILNLAAGDLFVLFIVVGLHISEYYRQTWPVLWRTDAQCILHRFARFVGFNITIFEMMTIAIDRYLAVCFPMKFKASCTPKKTKLKILFLWVIALVAAIPIVLDFATWYGDDESEFDVNFAGKTPFACRFSSDLPVWYNEFRYVYIGVVLFYIPIVITAIIYVVIIVYVRRNNQQFAKMSNRAGNRLRSHWKTARTLLAAFIVYAACYVLLATCTLVLIYAPGSVSPTAKNLGIILPYANSCMNPVVYSVVNPRFRRSLADLFLRKSSTQSTTKSNPVTMTPRSLRPAESSDNSVKTSQTRIATGSPSASRVSNEKAAAAASSSSDCDMINHGIGEDDDVPI